ncbi:hypothetical protein ACQPTN_34985 [Bradyrhizobium sp. 13971]
MLMRNASEDLRGRVMGVCMMVIYGLPLGLLAAGSLIDLIGYTATDAARRRPACPAHGPKRTVCMTAEKIASSAWQDRAVVFV